MYAVSKRSSGSAAGADHTAPVTLERVRLAAMSFGFHSLLGDSRLIFPWNNHLLTVFVADADPPALRFESAMRTTMEFSDISSLAATINDWNHDRLGPTAQMRILDDSQVEIHARSFTLIGEGLSDEQLAEQVRLGIETTILLSRELVSTYGRLDRADGPDAERQRQEQDREAMDRALGGSIKQLSAEDLRLTDGPLPGESETAAVQRRPIIDNEDQVMESPGDYSDEYSDVPSPVTIRRVREVLQELGITKTTEKLEAETLVAWINSILFGFFIDNGPSYLIKGHWDPELNPDSDFLRVFLLCNEWNEESITTKAYTHTDDSGLQVRVEFTVAVAAGLNDAQLRHNTAVALNHILAAIDSISQEATGAGAVEWPDSPPEPGRDHHCDYDDNDDES